MNQIRKQQTKRKVNCLFNSFSVPYALLHYAVKHKRFTTLQVYVATKFLYASKFFDKDVAILADFLNLNPKTIDTHLCWLVEAGWLSRDAKTGIYFIRNWSYVRTILKDCKRAGYYLHSSRICDFRAFAIAATYDRLIQMQKYRRWHGDRERRKKGTSKQTGLRAYGFYPVANAAYSKIFGVSESTASRYRRLAHNEGFIKILEYLRPSGLPTDNRSVVSVIKEEYNVQLIYREGEYYVQGISHIKSNMIRKKIALLPSEKTASIKKGNL